jgi:hypothetical protein
LADLKSKRAAMSRGAWKYDNVNGTVEAPEAGPNRYLGKTVCEMYIANIENNATGIVATHNAVDVLIEIVEAALAYEQAKIDAAVIRYTYATAVDRRTVGAQRIEAHDRDEIRCREALRAALAKITP